MRKCVYVTNNVFRMNDRFKLFPECGPIQGISMWKITNFGNLQFSYSIELGSAEGWDENVKLFLTVDCFKHLSLERKYPPGKKFFHAQKRFRSSSPINFTFLILTERISWLNFSPYKRSTKTKSQLSKFSLIFFNLFPMFSRLLKIAFLFSLTTVIC